PISVGFGAARVGDGRVVALDELVLGIERPEPAASLSADGQVTVRPLVAEGGDDPDAMSSGHGEGVVKGAPVACSVARCQVLEEPGTYDRLARSDRGQGIVECGTR